MDDKPASPWFFIAWIVIFAILVFAANGWLDSGKASHVSSSETIERRQLVLRADRQHHYFVKGKINNHDVEFLLDTGASSVAVPRALAKKIGLSEQYPVVVSTANGRANAYLTRIQHLQLGPIKLSNVSALIMTNDDSKRVLLGMSALKQLEFTQAGDILTIIQALPLK